MAKADGEKIKERYEKARADYQAHQKRERAQHKKLKAQADTERKLVAGEFVLFLLENGEYDRERFKYLDDNRRRLLFGLPALDEGSETAEQDDTLPLDEQASVET